MFWVVPPFLALTLSLVLRLSARVKSSAAAQQVAGLVSLPLIMIAYSQSTGALFGATNTGYVIGALAWIAALFGLIRGHALDDPRPPPRRRRRSLSPATPSPAPERTRVDNRPRVSGFSRQNGGRGFRRATVRLSPR